MEGRSNAMRCFEQRLVRVCWFVGTELLNLSRILNKPSFCRCGSLCITKMAHALVGKALSVVPTASSVDEARDAAEVLTAEVLVVRAVVLAGIFVCCSSP